MTKKKERFFSHSQTSYNALIYKIMPGRLMFFSLIYPGTIYQLVFSINYKLDLELKHHLLYLFHLVVSARNRIPV